MFPQKVVNLLTFLTCCVAAGQINFSPVYKGDVDFFGDGFHFGFPNSKYLVASASNHGFGSGGNKEGGGKEYHSKKYNEYGAKGDKGYETDHYEDKTKLGKHGKHYKAGDYHVSGGHHDKHHNEAGHYKKHNEGKKSHKAAKFGEKKGHKKGHKTKGYQNKFHKDEYHKEHKFYDDFHKSGHHSKHGDHHEHWSKGSGSFEKGGKENSGHHYDDHGKKGYSDKAKVADDHKGYKDKQGHDSYHKHYEDYKNSKGVDGSKHFGYSSGKH